MAWRRINILGEGRSEVQFIKTAITPHFAKMEVQVTPMAVMTSRRHDAKGGLQNYAKFRNDIERLLKSQPDAFVSTMIDLFRIPGDFPGVSESRRFADPVEQAKSIEAAIAQDISSPNLVPYIQVHEFETLLYVNLDVIKPRIKDSHAAIEALKAEVANLAPESINGGPQTAPSKRLIKHLPAYRKNKLRVGAPAAAFIGLSGLRQSCPHFDEWVCRLEAL